MQSKTGIIIPVHKKRLRTLKVHKNRKYLINNNVYFILMKSE